MAHASPERSATLSSLGAHEGGVVYAEFIAAFTPFFLLFLGVVQLAFIGAAGLVVQTAAVKAVRAASVVLDDDPIFYKQEARGLLDFNSDAEDDGWVNGVGGELTGGGAGWIGHNDGDGNWQRTNQLGELKNKGGPRLRAIRRAAYLPLAAISPEWSTVVGWFPMISINLGSLGATPEKQSMRLTALGLHPMYRLVTGFLVYNPIAAAVNFPATPNAARLRNAGEGFSGRVQYGNDEPVTVRVTYLYPCAVPIASLFVCNTMLGMTGVEDSIDAISGIGTNPSLEDVASIGDDLREAWADQQQAYNDFRRNFAELQAGAEYPAFQYALFVARNARFHVLRREATLPVQGAPYRYPTEAPPP